MKPLRLFLMAALLSIVFGMNNVEAEDPPALEWNNSFVSDIGYTSNTGAYSIQQTTDGNYIVAGSVGYVISDTLQMDAILIKIDSNGNEIWNRTFSSQNNNNTFPDYTAASSVKQTNDGGYIITGCYNCTGNADLLLIKTDGNGIEQWITRFNLTENGLEKGYDVMQTADNGFIVYGKQLVKFDSSGNEEWNQTFEGIVGMDTRIEQASDGGYVIVDITAFGGYDALVIKTDSNGTEEWNQTFGGSGTDAIFSIQSVSDEGYILAGYTAGSFGNNSSVDGWLIKIDLEGNEKWNKTFGGQSYDGFFSVTQDYSGHYIATGHTQSFGNANLSNVDIWIVKVDDKGNEIWNQTFGGDYYDQSFSIQETDDAGFVITGRCSSGKYQSIFNYTSWKYEICVIKFGGNDGIPSATIDSIDPP